MFDNIAMQANFEYNYTPHLLDGNNNNVIAHYKNYYEHGYITLSIECWNTDRKNISFVIDGFIDGENINQNISFYYKNDNTYKFFYTIAAQLYNINVPESDKIPEHIEKIHSYVNPPAIYDPRVITLQLMYDNNNIPGIQAATTETKNFIYDQLIKRVNALIQGV